MSDAATFSGSISNGHAPAAAAPRGGGPVYETARRYLDCGLSPFPIPANGTKEPKVKWKPFQDKPITHIELQKHFFGVNCGIGIALGRVSGNAECIDFDDGSLFEPFAEEVNDLAPGLLDRVTIHRTPRLDGKHVIYRCDTIEGNQPLAQRWGEDKNGRPTKKPTIETRGQGGYILMPGSAPKTHPSGKPYEHESGPLATSLATITPEERAIMFRVARSLNEVADDRDDPVPRTSGRGDSTGLRPGSDFSQRATWEEILEPHGWKKGVQERTYSGWD